MRGTPIIPNDPWWGTSWGLPWSNMLCWLFQGHSKFIPPSSTKGIWTLVAIETIPNKTIEDVGLMVKPKRIIENSFTCHFVLIKTSSPSSAANSSHARCKEILRWNPCATELGCFLRKAEKHNFWEPMITDFESMKYLYTLPKNQPKRPWKKDHPGNTCSIVFHVDIEKSTGPPDMYKTHVSNGIWYIYIYIYLPYQPVSRTFVHQQSGKASSAPSRPNRSRQTPEKKVVGELSGFWFDEVGSRWWNILSNMYIVT